MSREAGMREELLWEQTRAWHRIDIGMRCGLYWLLHRARDQAEDGMRARARILQESKELPEYEEVERLQVMDDWRCERENITLLQQREHEAQVHRDALEALGAIEQLRREREQADLNARRGLEAKVSDTRLAIMDDWRQKWSHLYEQSLIEIQALCTIAEQ